MKIFKNLLLIPGDSSTDRLNSIKFKNSEKAKKCGSYSIHMIFFLIWTLEKHQIYYCKMQCPYCPPKPFPIQSFQDFLIQLDIKPHMHLAEISIFSLNNVTVRLTKIMNNLHERLKILIFKVIFQCEKLIVSFQLFFFEDYWFRRLPFNNFFFF